MGTETWLSSCHFGDCGNSHRISFNITPNHIEVVRSVPVSARINSLFKTLFEDLILLCITILFLGVKSKGVALKARGEHL